MVKFVGWKRQWHRFTCKLELCESHLRMTPPGNPRTFFLPGRPSTTALGTGAPHPTNAYAHSACGLRRLPHEEGTEQRRSSESPRARPAAAAASSSSSESAVKLNCAMGRTARGRGRFPRRTSPAESKSRCQAAARQRPRCPLTSWVTCRGPTLQRVLDVDERGRKNICTKSQGVVAQKVCRTRPRRARIWSRLRPATN